MDGEALLQFVWKTGFEGMQRLYSLQGRELLIIRPGELNTDSGPDFSHARIQTDGIILAGNIEIHINSSDWFRHGHHHDPAYQSVILHLVFRHDLEDGDPRNDLLPLTAEIGGLLPAELLLRYRRIMESDQFIPCGRLWKSAGEFAEMEFWAERLMVERLERKTQQIGLMLQAAGGDWERVLWVLLMRYLQSTANAAAGERLGWMMPQTFYRRQREQFTAIAGMLLGQSGLLHSKADFLMKEVLVQEYRFQKRLWNVEAEMRPQEWKMSRMRPQGFPHVRLLQWAWWWYSKPLYWGDMIAASESLQELRSCFSPGVPDAHEAEQLFHPLQFGMGEERTDLLILNAVIPLLFAYGKFRDRPDYCERAIDLMPGIAAENNKVSRSWAGLGWKAEHALHSQAQLELHGQYCMRKRCLDCRLGRHLLII